MLSVQYFADQSPHFNRVYHVLVLYVDALFLIGSMELIEECKKDLVTEFKMKDSGLMH